MVQARRGPDRRRFARDRRSRDMSAPDGLHVPGTAITSGWSAADRGPRPASSDHPAHSPTERSPTPPHPATGPQPSHRHSRPAPVALVAARHPRKPRGAIPCPPTRRGSGTHGPPPHTVRPRREPDRSRVARDRRSRDKSARDRVHAPGSVITPTRSLRTAPDHPGPHRRRRGRTSPAQPGPGRPGPDDRDSRDRDPHDRAPRDRGPRDGRRPTEDPRDVARRHAREPPQRTEARGAEPPH